MINYIEKGEGLHQAIRDAGHRLWQSKQPSGVYEWRSTNDAAVQAIIDSYDPVTGLRSELILQIKSLAQEKIFTVLPAWKQSNYNGRMNELNAIKAGCHPIEAQRALTNEEVSEIGVMFTAMNSVRAIRAASDAKEAEVAALTTYTELVAYDIESGW